MWNKVDDNIYLIQSILRNAVFYESLKEMNKFKTSFILLDDSFLLVECCVHKCLY